MKKLLLLFLLAISSTAFGQSKLPPCQGTNISTWNMCFGKHTGPDPIFPNVTRTYVGEYKDGESSGRGTETFPNGAKYVGNFIGGKRIGQGIGTYPDGSKYVGEWRNGSRNGQGTYTFPNGDKYVGGIKDAKLHGQGTYTYRNGTIDNGTWENGKFITPQSITRRDANQRSEQDEINRRADPAIRPLQDAEQVRVQNKKPKLNTTD
jgi:hypothetical protein